MSLAEAFLEQMNEFHTKRQPYDDTLDIWLHESYAKKLRQGRDVDWSKPYFSPSSASACPRALYHKLKKHKKDVQDPTPHQRRWTAMGTLTGDLIQREILLAERHMKKLCGKEPRFVIGITEEKYPAFEDFVFVQKVIEHNGETFSIVGTGDGLMVDKETGELVMLEVKSKSEGASKTNYTQMKSAKQDHIDQVTCYSIMYETRTGIITYLNLSKQKWMADEETLEKNPDLRAFDVNVTDGMQQLILDKFADITRRARENDPPLPDLTSWMFNDYKTKIAETITDEEIAKLETVVASVKKSSQQAWMKRSVENALDDIKRRRAKL